MVFRISRVITANHNKTMLTTKSRSCSFCFTVAIGVHTGGRHKICSVFSVAFRKALTERHCLYELRPHIRKMYAHL